MLERAVLALAEGPPPLGRVLEERDEARDRDDGDPGGPELGLEREPGERHVAAVRAAVEHRPVGVAAAVRRASQSCSAARSRTESSRCARRRGARSASRSRSSRGRSAARPRSRSRRSTGRAAIHVGRRCDSGPPWISITTGGRSTPAGSNRKTGIDSPSKDAKRSTLGLDELVLVDGRRGRREPRASRRSRCRRARRSRGCAARRTRTRAGGRRARARYPSTTPRPGSSSSRRSSSVSGSRSSSRERPPRSPPRRACAPARSRRHSRSQSSSSTYRQLAGRELVAGDPDRVAARAGREEERAAAGQPGRHVEDASSSSGATRTRLAGLEVDEVQVVVAACGRSAAGR